MRNEDRNLKELEFSLPTDMCSPSPYMLFKKIIYVCVVCLDVCVSACLVCFPRPAWQTQVSRICQQRVESRTYFFFPIYPYLLPYYLKQISTQRELLTSFTRKKKCESFYPKLPGEQMFWASEVKTGYFPFVFGGHAGKGAV